MFFAAVVHFLAVIGCSKNVTFPLLKVLPLDVSNCFATSGSRYWEMPLEVVYFCLAPEVEGCEKFESCVESECKSHKFFLNP